MTNFDHFPKNGQFRPIWSDMTSSYQNDHKDPTKSRIWPGPGLPRSRQNDQKRPFWRQNRPFWPILAEFGQSRPAKFDQISQKMTIFRHFPNWKKGNDPSGPKIRESQDLKIPCSVPTNRKLLPLNLCPPNPVNLIPGSWSKGPNYPRPLPKMGLKAQKSPFWPNPARAFRRSHCCRWNKNERMFIFYSRSGPSRVGPRAAKSPPNNDDLP